MICNNEKCAQYKKFTTDNFCRECGEKTRVKVCKYCNTSVTSFDKFCGFCGRPIDE